MCFLASRRHRRGARAHGPVVCTARRVSGGWIARFGWIPASCGDVRPCVPLHSLAQVRPSPWPCIRFPVLHTYSDGIRLPIFARSPKAARSHGAAPGEPPSEICVPPVQTHSVFTVAHDSSFGLRDAEYAGGTGSSTSICPQIALQATFERRSASHWRSRHAARCP